MQALATKYRPNTFEDVCAQGSIIKILSRQIELKEFKNAYLFCGASGCGKTTIARIFANQINGGCGFPIEIDAASNNGVDRIKEIIADAQLRSLDGEYKIIIMDECHALTNQSWQAFLKCIEEPPKYTVFIFCTTDPQKIPGTILNRCQRFNFTKIPLDKIKSRLRYICEQEQLTVYDDSIDFLAEIADGCMRAAISNLDKCVSYSKDLTIQNVLVSLGSVSYDLYFNLLNCIVEHNEQRVLKAIDYFYGLGTDMRLFVEQFFEFCIDVAKYCIYQSISMTKLPSTVLSKLEACAGIPNAIKIYNSIMDGMLNLKNMLKNDSYPKSTIEVVMLQMTRAGE